MTFCQQTTVQTPHDDPQPVADPIYTSAPNRPHSPVSTRKTLVSGSGATGCAHTHRAL